MTTLSTTPNPELMAQARASLRGRWGLAVGATLVYVIVGNALQFVPRIGFVWLLLTNGALGLGWAIFALAIARDQGARVGMVFQGFRRYGLALATSLVMGVFILLWGLLLIIPGIIAALRYSQTYYVIADDPAIGPLAAIRRSKAMMVGNKWKLFCLGLRFIGWGLLCVVTLGIGFLWIGPYMSVSFAKFYGDVSQGQSTQAHQVAPQPEPATA
jgi:uncharacterized membrane protein